MVYDSKCMYSHRMVRYDFSQRGSKSLTTSGGFIISNFTSLRFCSRLYRAFKSEVRYFFKKVILSKLLLFLIAMAIALGWPIKMHNFFARVIAV